MASTIRFHQYDFNPAARIVRPVPNAAIWIGNEWLVRPDHRKFAPLPRLRETVRISPASLPTIGENSELARFTELIAALEEPGSGE